MKTIKEIRTDLNNNESAVKAGVYQEKDGTYTWMTYTRSGSCKTLKNALKKAGL
jgi:hypothetical protein